jgi:hypothetical protein
MEGMREEEAKVGNLETGMRARVRGEEWVSRLTAGRDMMCAVQLIESRDQRLEQGDPSEF